MEILILLLLLAGPVLYFINRIKNEKRYRKRKPALATAYERLVLQHKLSVEYHDLVGNSIIAFDRKNKKLLIIDHNNAAAKQEACISLTSIALAIINEERNEKGDLERLTLHLKQKGNNDIIKICFFDAGVNPVTQLPALSRKALYWEQRLNTPKTYNYAAQKVALNLKQTG